MSCAMSSSSIKVAVRARPLSQRESIASAPLCVEMNDSCTLLHNRKSLDKTNVLRRKFVKEFHFDYSYWSVDVSDDEYASQETVFSDLGVPVLKATFEGYNTCIFAYGQTGSGKTYTMMGTPEALGLIPRICEFLFSQMAKETEKGEAVSYKTEVSYMEIYNEKVRDLLTSESGKSHHSLRVREHTRHGPYVEDLSKFLVEDYVEIKRLIDIGNQHRATASTKMNETSSRSHAIFSIIFTQAKFESDLPVETVSKVNLVDLAGSERASATGAEGQRLKEGGSINRSLVCLGTVISSLAERGSNLKKAFVPYRDSVLTWLLKDSLGGNSKTVMIAAISPAESSYGETLSTLRYASRAKNIVNRPTVNEDPNVKLIHDLKEEIQRLKTVIASGDAVLTLPPSPSKTNLVEDIYKKEEKIAELTKEWVSKWKDIQRIIQDRNLALHSDGTKMIVDSSQPHLVGLSPDVFSTGLVFYYLKNGVMTVGTNLDDQQPDILISGKDIHPQHCVIHCSDEDIFVQPLQGICFINRMKIETSTKLSQGDLLQLGSSTLLRFNHPEEAQRLRLSEVSTDHKVLQLESSLVTLHSPSSSSVSVGVQHKSLPSQPSLKYANPELRVVHFKNSASYRPIQHSKSRSKCMLLFSCVPLLSCMTLMALPAFMMLVLLNIGMKFIMLLQRSPISSWLSVVAAMCLVTMVSPVAGFCDAIFRLLFSALCATGTVTEINFRTS